MIALFVVAVRSALAVVLTISAAAKLVDLRGFARTLADLKIGLKSETSRWFAVAIPLIELILALLLVMGLAERFVALAVATLFAAFTCVSSWAAINRVSARCRCFGALTDGAFNGLGIARSGLLFGGAIIVCIFAWTSTATEWAPFDLWLVVLGLLALGGASAQASWTLDYLKSQET